MVIWQVGNRHVIFNGKAREELKVTKGCAMKYAETIVKEWISLQLLAEHIITLSKCFYGITEFCYCVLADGVGVLPSRISPEKCKTAPREDPQGWLSGFA
ncbi:MAG: hypothetical protein EOL87_09770 [Spartobacteria bacterium]|nr:hypothetical protein [Spartobacteria bacterium]